MLSDKKNSYTVILDKAVKAEIDRIALSMDRSASWLINDILKKYLENKKSQ
jgi:predicted transcriptional regulator